MWYIVGHSIRERKGKREIMERKDISTKNVKASKMRRWWEFCFNHLQECEDENCSLYWAFIHFANKTDDQGKPEEKGKS